MINALKIQNFQERLLTLKIDNNNRSIENQNIDIYDDNTG